MQRSVRAPGEARKHGGRVVTISQAPLELREDPARVLQPSVRGREIEQEHQVQLSRTSEGPQQLRMRWGEDLPLDPLESLEDALVGRAVALARHESAAGSLDRGQREAKGQQGAATRCPDEHPPGSQGCEASEGREHHVLDAPGVEPPHDAGRDAAQGPADQGPLVRTSRSRFGPMLRGDGPEAGGSQQREQPGEVVGREAAEPLAREPMTREELEGVEAVPGAGHQLAQAVPAEDRSPQPGSERHAPQAEGRAGERQEHGLLGVDGEGTHHGEDHEPRPPAGAGRAPQAGRRQPERQRVRTRHVEPGPGGHVPTGHPASRCEGHGPSVAAAVRARE